MFIPNTQFLALHAVNRKLAEAVKYKGLTNHMCRNSWTELNELPLAMIGISAVIALNQLCLLWLAIIESQVYYPAQINMNAQWKDWHDGNRQDKYLAKNGDKK